MESTSPIAFAIPSTSASSSLTSDVTLDAIMAQLQRMDAHLDTLSDELSCEYLCQSYSTMTASPWWFHHLSISFSRGFGR